MVRNICNYTCVIAINYPIGINPRGPEEYSMIKKIRIYLILFKFTHGIIKQYKVITKFRSLC